MATLRKSDFRQARRRVTLTPGDAVRVAREIQNMSQAELARVAGMSQPTISGIETGRVTLGADRAEKLARGLCVHPGVLLFPQWDAAEESKRAAS